MSMGAMTFYASTDLTLWLSTWHTEGPLQYVASLAFLVVLGIAQERLHTHRSSVAAAAEREDADRPCAPPTGVSSPPPIAPLPAATIGALPPRTQRTTPTHVRDVAVCAAAAPVVPAHARGRVRRTPRHPVTPCPRGGRSSPGAVRRHKTSRAELRVPRTAQS